MKAPDWYPDWKHEAMHQLLAKQEDLKANYGMGTYPRFDYDAEAGTLKFSEDGRVKVIADIQVVGTTGQQNWLWALANDHWPEPVVADMEAVLQFGLDNEIDELTTDYLEDDDLNQLGWDLTAVAVRVLNAVGAYRAPNKGRPGALFLLIKSIRHAS